MARPRDRSGKRKEVSPLTLEPSEVDVSALRQHRRAAGERRSKAREDARLLAASKSKEAGRRGSPAARRGRVIEVTSSEEDGRDDAPAQS